MQIFFFVKRKEISLKNNISEEEGSFTKDICYFLSGLLTGFGDFALYNAKVVETECSLIDTDAGVCRFVIENRNIEL